MGRNQITGNDSAVFGIDFIAAIVLVFMAVIMAIMVMPTLSHEDRDWRIKQYMTASRAADILVQDTGNPENWETDWVAKDYSHVMKIGFVYVDADNSKTLKVLDQTKVDALMVGHPNATGLNWWEYPDVHSKPWDAHEAGQVNVTRALGLDGYNFYIQLHPVALNGSDFDYTQLDMASINRSRLPINYETASMIDRYVYIHGPCEEGFLCYKGSTVHYRLNLWVW
jgi:hypothetical protein